MADVLIRGMEMPESCDKCNLFNGCWCMALGIENWRKSYNKPPEGERLSDCPLDPLPEGHGRLGDLTEIEKKLQKTLDGMGDRWLSSPSMMAQRVAIVADLKKVKEAITIIPAEGGTDDVQKQ